MPFNDYSNDLAESLSSTTAGNAFAPAAGRSFNITISGTWVGSLALERSFDGGQNYFPVTYPDGTAVAFTTNVSTSWEDGEGGVVYRLNFTRTSGTAVCRISQ